MAEARSRSNSVSDVFHNHKPTLISGLENPVVSIADYCRDADIIDLEFHRELVLVTDHKHKAEKLFKAVYDRIEAQPAHVDQEQCVFKRFVGVLRRDPSLELEEIAGVLETSYAETQAKISQEAGTQAEVETGLQARVSQDADTQAEVETGTQAEVSQEADIQAGGRRADNPLIAPTRGDPLDQLISKDHRNKIGKELRYWKKWAEELGLTGGEIYGIENDRSLDYNMFGQEVLRRWQNRFKATYRALCKVAVNVDERGMAEQICKLVNGDWSSVCGDVPGSNFRYPVESTEKVETISHVGYGREEQVSGLRQRRKDTPAILTNAQLCSDFNNDLKTASPRSTRREINEAMESIRTVQRPMHTMDDAYTCSARQELDKAMAALRKAKVQTHLSEAVIDSYKDKITDLNDQFDAMTIRCSQTSDELKLKKEELEGTRNQERLAKTGLRSQVANIEEDIKMEKALSEQQREKINELETDLQKCKDENEVLLEAVHILTGEIVSL